MQSQKRKTNAQKNDKGHHPSINSQSQAGYGHFQRPHWSATPTQFAHLNQSLWLMPPRHYTSCRADRRRVERTTERLGSQKARQKQGPDKERKKEGWRKWGSSERDLGIDREFWARSQTKPSPIW